jgi:hypothetical protein
LILNNSANGSTGAFFNAFVAVRALLFVFYDFKNTYLFKKPGDQPCRAKKMAKWPVVD